MSDDSGDPQSIVKRERSPSFPYLDLGVALEQAEKLYIQAKMNEVRLPDVAQAWEMTPKSGSMARYISALSQFGLLDTNGSGDGRRFRLSADAHRILEDGRPGVREELLSDAALRPKLIRGLYLGEDDFPEWRDDRPSDGIAESALKFDLSFTTEAARRFLSVYDSTIQYVGAKGEDSKAVDSQPQSQLESRLEEGLESTMDAHEVVRATPERPPAPVELNKIDFQSDGPGVIVISAKLDAEGLQMLEKKISAFKMLLN